MSGVYIKGLKMPKNCLECKFNKWHSGKGNVCCIDDSILFAKIENYEVKYGSEGDCPLIEIPDHGDLIDKDELYRETAEWEEQARNQVNEGWTKWNIILTERTAFKYDVADAPTIIPADKEER